MHSQHSPAHQDSQIFGYSNVALQGIHRWSGRETVGKYTVSSFFKYNLNASTLCTENIVHMLWIYFSYNSPSSLDPPEISERSFCTRSHSDTQCTCVVESNPPSGVWWIWDNSDKKSPQMQDGFTTMAVDLLPPDLHQIVCFASNIHGNTTKILHVKKGMCLDTGP